MKNFGEQFNPINEPKMAATEEVNGPDQRAEDMKRLAEIENKVKSKQELTKEDLRFLYNLDSYMAPINENYRKQEELQQNRDLKNDLAKATGFSAEQISIDEVEALKGGIKFHYGQLNIDDDLLDEARGKYNLTSAEKIILPEIIFGDLELDEWIGSAEGFKFPQSVTGRLNLENLGELEEDEKLDLPQSVGGNVYVDIEWAKGIKLPQSIGGDLHLDKLATTKGIKWPQSIGGSIYVGNLDTPDIRKLRKKFPNNNIVE